MATHVVTAKGSLLAARLFNIASMVATVFAPLLMVWIAISICMYASIAHHPNPRTVYYNRWAGYRFYGAAGTMVAAGQPIYALFDNWRGLVLIWVLMMLVVVPWGLRDIWRAGKEEWQDMTIEVENRE